MLSEQVRARKRGPDVLDIEEMRERAPLGSSSFFSDPARFWRYVSTDGRTVAGMQDGCWTWTSPKCGGPRAGGTFSVNGTVMPAARAALVLAGFVAPRSLFVLHVCDDRTCVHPGHLFFGTCRFNAQDSVRKRRNAGVHPDPDRAANVRALTLHLIDVRGARSDLWPAWTATEWNTMIAQTRDPS